ncbi:hypothetical protein NA57DRAFT_29188, partial [Rhizodiscina lignyota]
SLAKEKLAVSPEAAELLQETISAPDEYPIMGLETPRRRSELKQELPLLLSDNEYDMQHFGRRVIPDFQHTKIPPEVVDEERDEGLTWPTRYLALPARLDADARRDKLEVAKEVLLCIQNAISDPVTIEERENLIAIELQASKVTSCWRIDGSDTHLVQHKVPLGQLYFSLDSSPEPHSLTPLKRKLADLRVEGPLTPPLPTELPQKRSKTVSFPEMLHEVIPELPSAFLRKEDLPESTSDFDTFMHNQIAPLAEQANQEVEQEQLIEADSTNRVSVPSIAPIKPTPPWMAYLSIAERRSGGASALAAQRQLLKDIKSQEMAYVPSWHGVTKNERQLTWSPFPIELSKVELDERINVGPVLKQILEEFEASEVLDSSAIVWKLEGLRILDDAWDDDDEDLEPAEVDKEEMGFDDLLKRKALDFKTHDSNLKPSHQPERNAPPPKASSAPDVGTIFGGAFSASAALDKFLRSRGETVKESEGPSNGVLERSSHIDQPQTRPASGKRNRAQDIDKELLDNTTMSIEHPEIPASLPPRPFIVSSAFLKTCRGLYRATCALYPTAELIERDFSSLQIDESDIILSPSTGLLFTTLQKIKQRPLPGQEDNHCGIKERIIAVSRRFESLLVFVSDNTTSASMDERDCMAVAELSGFVAALDAEIQICYIPGGDDQIARWVVNAMHRYGITPGQDSMKLLQDETLWEQFLRRTGMNAFAAQVVLTELKPPVSAVASSSNVSEDRNTGYDERKYGIAGFVRMGQEERVKRFAEVLGGRSVLDRVSMVLGPGWTASA